jgi:hypothetical protein
VPDLLRYAEGSPFLLLALVILGAVLYAAEKLFALSGPMSGLVHWWQGRELAKLKRDAEVRAARRAIQAEEESALLRSLREQLAELETQIARLREERRRRGSRKPSPSDLPQLHPGDGTSRLPSSG